MPLREAFVHHREYISKLKMANSKPPKEKASASQCLTLKRVFLEKKTLAKEAEGDPNTHLTQSRVDLSQEQHQSNISNSPYPSETGEKSSLQEEPFPASV